MFQRRLEVCGVRAADVRELQAAYALTTVLRC
jgi:hypothetical protein